LFFWYVAKIKAEATAINASNMATTAMTQAMLAREAGQAGAISAGAAEERATAAVQLAQVDTDN